MNDRDLEELIQDCIERKDGDKEFALFYEDEEWTVMIGSLYMGDFKVEEKKTAREAVSALLTLIELNRRS